MNTTNTSNLATKHDLGLFEKRIVETFVSKKELRSFRDEVQNSFAKCFVNLKDLNRKFDILLDQLAKVTTKTQEHWD